MWVTQKKLSRGTDQVQKLTDGCLGAFNVISGHLDVQETTLNTIEQRAQCVETRLQGVEDGIHAILNILQARPPVNNQVAAAAAPVAIGEERKEETKEEETKEEGKSFCSLQLLILFFTHLVVVRFSTETGEQCPAGANASARHGSGLAQDPCLAQGRMGLQEPGRLRSPFLLGELEACLVEEEVPHGGHQAQAADRRVFSC